MPIDPIPRIGLLAIGVGELERIGLEWSRTASGEIVSSDFPGSGNKATSCQSATIPAYSLEESPVTPEGPSPYDSFL